MSWYTLNSTRGTRRRNCLSQCIDSYSWHYASKRTLYKCRYGYETPGLMFHKTIARGRWKFSKLLPYFVRTLGFHKTAIRCCGNKPARRIGPWMWSSRSLVSFVDKSMKTLFNANRSFIRYESVYYSKCAVRHDSKTDLAICQITLLLRDGSCISGT